MDKEKLENRIQELTQEKEKHAILIHMINGAIQECDNWIKKIEQNKSEEINDEIITNTG